MQKVKGFTLIELLIVVAIIAILAAIAVPNFLEAQVRSKVSRVKADLRVLATGLEAYYVDYNMYVASASKDSADFQSANNYWPITSNSNLKNASPGGLNRLTMRCYQVTGITGPHMAKCLTTPVSFISKVPYDPFASTKKSAFGYWNARSQGWIV